MASPPRKRPPRKTRPNPPKKTSNAGPRGTARRPPALVDPQTVATVRRLTAQTVHALVKTGRVVGGSVGVALARAGRWLAPRLLELGKRGARASWRGLIGSARWLWAQREILARVTHRGLWWGALAILILVGRALLTAEGDPELVEVAMLWFGAGLSMSVLVLLGAPEPRMRVAAVALAGGHGSLAALAWVAFGLG